jgi:putative transposase
MARIARVVVPGYPHHVIQRGSRRQPTFSREADYNLYIGLLAEWCQRHDVEI